MAKDKGKCEYLYIGGMRVPMRNVVVTIESWNGRKTQSFRVAAQSPGPNRGEPPIYATIKELKKLLKNDESSTMSAHIYDPETMSTVGEPFEFDPANVRGTEGRILAAKGRSKEWDQFADNEFVALILAKGVSYGKSKGLTEINIAQLDWLARTPAGVEVIRDILGSTDSSLVDVKLMLAANSATIVPLSSKVREAFSSLAPLVAALGFDREILSPTPPEKSPNLIDLKNAEILKKAEAKGVNIDNDAKTKKHIKDRLALLDDKRFPQNSDYEREKIKLVPVSDYRKQSIELAVRSGKSARDILFELPGSLEDKPGVADDFATRLTLTRVIAEARGDTQLVEDIDKFVADVASMDNAQFAAEYLEASKKFESPFDQRSVVMVREPHAVVTSGRYRTVHEGSRSMGGQADRSAGGAEKIAEIRRNVERSRLGFDSNDMDAETASLRPSSSLTLSTHFAEDRAENLKKIHGPDVVIQYNYPTVSAEGISKTTRGDRREKNNLVDGRAYGQASIILRPEVAQRTLAVSGDSVSGGVDSPASRLSTIKENPEAASLFHSPQSVMFEARTGRKNTIASAAQNEATGYYIEGMTVGSFETGDIQAIVTPLMGNNTGSGIAADYIEFGEPNDSATGMNLSATLTALIGGTRARDDYAEKYKIDVVLQSIFFDLNEVEPFNPTMTQGYIAQQMAKGAFGGVKVEDLNVTPTVTPYEILLQVNKMNALRGGKIGGFLHPKNVKGRTLEAEATNRENYVAMIDEELSRLSGSPAVSGIGLVDRG